MLPFSPTSTPAFVLWLLLLTGWRGGISKWLWFPFLWWLRMLALFLCHFLLRLLRTVYFHAFSPHFLKYILHTSPLSDIYDFPLHSVGSSPPEGGVLLLFRSILVCQLLALMPVLLSSIYRLSIFPTFSSVRFRVSALMLRFLTHNNDIEQ